MRKQIVYGIGLLLVSLILGACGAPAQPAGSTSGGGLRGGEAALSLPTVYSSNTPGLTVVGSGTVEAQPDIAYVSLGVDLKGADAAAIVAEATRKMEAVLAALKDSGVAEEEIHTVAYNLWVEQRYDPQTGQPTGVFDYHIVHTVRAAVHDLGRVGQVLAGAVEAGANSISEVSFSVAEPEALVAQARARAIADAQKRAQEMASALGITLGKVVSVSESGGWVPGPYYAKGGGAEALAPVPMPSGSFSVSISVVVVYELP
ncbi:MAG: SIMPL domain-containing protein [Chloroflexia bacterium]